MLCSDLWLGLEAKPLVVESEGAALEGDVRELEGEDRPLPAWDRSRTLSVPAEHVQGQAEEGWLSERLVGEGWPLR